MAHFAQLDSNNVVTRVIVIPNSSLTRSGVTSESYGVEYLRELFSNQALSFKQTSYSGSIRDRFAGIGSTYDPSLDIFINPKPFPSWVKNSTGDDWVSPLGAAPEVTVTNDPPAFYVWDEDAYNADPTTGWILVTPQDASNLPPL
jgi:hypothetical protein